MVKLILCYIENSYFIISVPIFSYKVKNQLQYPRKLYFIDNIFIKAISTRFSKNYGRLYENLVAIELLRRCAKNPLIEFYYWKNSRHEEVDFVVKNDEKIEQLIQVCYDISDQDTKKRELRVLVKASKELRCNNLLIITEDYDAYEQFKDKRIRFTPLWKWMLSYGARG